MIIEGTVWRHVKTGDIRRVAGIDDRTNSVTLTNPAGGERNVSPEQLENLYFETDDPGDLAAFTAADVPGTIEAAEVTPGNDPGAGSALPLPDRRRFNNGSTRSEGH